LHPDDAIFEDDFLCVVGSSDTTADKKNEEAKHSEEKEVVWEEEPCQFKRPKWLDEKPEERWKDETIEEKEEGEEQEQEQK